MTDPIRDHLARLLSWTEAHVGFDAAVDGLDPALRGIRPPGLPHSAWELLDHLARAQADLLAFCTATTYAEPDWPADYWPDGPEPPSPAAWDEAITSFRADREALAELARTADLFAPARHGSAEQTVLRALLLASDHAAYHVGQIVLVRRALGAW